VGLPPLSAAPDPDGADCVACGRCCHHGPQTVHLLAADEERLGPELLERLTEVHERSGYRFLRNADGRCACLDVSEPGRFPCTIYARRPDDCRVVRPGSACCLDARRLGRLGRVCG
jgi:Fe-S-cluster containining protein